MSGKTSIESKLSNLRIDLPGSTKASPSKRDDGVVESWEDGDGDLSEDDSNNQTPTEGPGPSLKPVKSMDPALNPPPPTPISPGNSGQYVDWEPAGALGGGRPSTRPYTPPTPQSEGDRDRKRPEKTTSTASRMIAAGLGIKAPKKTEEQRQYDRAVRDQEIKRKNKEKEDKEREREADEKAKASVWDG